MSDNEIEKIAEEYALASGYYDMRNSLAQYCKKDFIAGFKANQSKQGSYTWGNAELSSNVKVTISSLPFPTSIEEYENVIANLIEAIPSQTNDNDWWPDSLTDAVNEANKLLENKKPNQK